MFTHHNQQELLMPDMEEMTRGTLESGKMFVFEIFYSRHLIVLLVFRLLQEDSYRGTFIKKVSKNKQTNSFKCFRTHFF